MKTALQVEELTSGASGRIIPVFKNLRRSILSYDALRRLFLLIYSFFVWILLLIPRRHRLATSPPSSPTVLSASVKRRKFGLRRDEEDTLRRRALAEAKEMVEVDASDWNNRCNWSTSLFFGTRRNALFCRSWFPASGDLKGILIIIHGLNEHSGRYTHFAKQLISSNFGVYAMDWTGHGGSDGLHGYVPSLDHVVADTGAFLEKIKLENPGTPCFLFGHSTGGAVVLKAATYPRIEAMLEGIILTSPALRVKPAHPIVGAVAPIFSLVVPRFQFKGANKRGIPVSRDPAALLAGADPGFE